MAEQTGTEIAKAYVRIIPTTKGVKGEIKKSMGDEAEAAGEEAGKKAGLNLASMLKKVIAAAGIGAALKTALNEGANLQQSLGGIETLFKDSADKVIASAQNAYKTAGMSANDYMETVTGFSASLLQGLAGDTDKAADIADMALTDMADNANKMGTSMESIQNAYQGFAKQNYTMLDNLKLGYGGTKTEMERLLKDAEAFSGVKYDIDNLGDVYEAIHVIQGEMSISGRTAEEAAEIIARTGRSAEEVYEQLGTTALEAATTYSGSLAMMKSSLSNLLGNLTLGEDIRPAVEALISSTGVFVFDNLLPMVGNILAGLVDYIVDTAVNTDWTAVITQVLEKIRDVLSTGLVNCFGADTTLVNDTFGFLIDGIPIVEQILQGAFALLQELWTAVGEPVWEMISYAVTSVSDLFAQYMPAIMECFQMATEGMKDTWENHLKPIFDMIYDCLNNRIKPVFEFVWKTIVEPLIVNVFGVIADLWNYTLKPVFDGICDFLLGVFTDDWQRAFQGILNIVIGIFNAIQTAVETPMNAVKDIVNAAIEFIKDKFNFEWAFPSIKLPHFHISGSFSLSPPSVPSFGVEWYAKAMNKPMIMNSPTAFGINSLGQIMAGGEAGSEVVSGTETLMKMISSAVAAQNASLEEALYRVLEAIQNMDENMADNLREALEGLALQLNKRDFARLVKEVYG